MRIGRRVGLCLLVGTLGVVIGVVLPAVVTPGVDGSGNQSAPPNTSKSAPPSTGPVSDDYFLEVRNFDDSLPLNPTVDEIRALATLYSAVNPEGPGPWPFAAIPATPSLGLAVRNAPGAEGVEIGRVEFNAAAWAICQLGDDGENAGVAGGRIWYKIRWPNERPSSEFFFSSPSDRFTGWIPAELGVPIGHNGKISSCPR